MRKWIYLIISVIIFGSIFWFSSKDAEASSAQSDELIVKLKLMTKEEIIQHPEMARKYRFLVRKTAHFLMYFMLGGVLFLTVKGFTEAYGFAFLMSWFLTIILAGIDEYHQSFVPGRSMEIRDVLIDSGGAFISIALLYICFKLFERKKSNRRVYYFHQ